MSKRTAKKKKVDDDDMDLDEEDERVLFFIPSAGINIDVLVWYLQKFLGHDSDAEPGRNPRNRDVDGYFIRSRLGLSSDMVDDLKDDSRDWVKEKRATRARTGYGKSETARRREESGASGRPTIFQKTQDPAAARRAESIQPTLQGAGQGFSTQQFSSRVPAQQDTVMQPGSFSTNFQPQESTRQHGTYSGQQSTFSYASPTLPQSRTPAINVNLNMNTAAYSQNVPPRHGTSPQQGSVLPSIEGRSGPYGTPAPPYEEETKGGGGQPSTTGSHGFSGMYSTAGPGSRHNR